MCRTYFCSKINILETKSFWKLVYAGKFALNACCRPQILDMNWFNQNKQRKWDDLRSEHYLKTTSDYLRQGDSTINTQGSFTLFYVKKNTSCCQGSFTLFEVIWGHEHLLKSTLYELILQLYTRYSLTLFNLVLRKNSQCNINSWWWGRITLYEMGLRL